MTAFFAPLLVIFLPAAALGVVYVLRRKASGISGVVAFTRIAAWIGVALVGGSMLVGTVTAIANGESTVQAPVEPYWPEFPAVSDVTPDHGDAVRSEITTVTVTATNLGVATRGFLAAGSLVTGLATIAVLAAVIALCSKLLAGKPFSDSLLRAGRLAACALAFGTLIGQTLTGIGTYRAGEETLRVDGYASTGDQVFSGSSPWPDPTFSINYEFAPLFMALAILVVVELVNAGMKMARQNERLRAETEGLI
ncbi:hypothetical protein [Glutamicibacter protophormiae]|uniref:hypothetical protein n=1 Tax=Glutamicibacter protophormiae TaxID=37930 RepID=UPI00195D6E11|nr:hypothetical protein [Glutamicibacter protophormiae]QRQ78764.1 hypothetical protein JQN66_00335 [Glutamicibacter protophormiae]